jgi:uncharacterized protein (DUF697 family)
MPVLTSLQISMVAALGRVYKQTLTFGQALGVIGTLAGGFFAQAVGRELVKFIPGIGSVVATSWAVGYTWALGEGACLYFGDLMAGKKPDPEAIQAMMSETFQQAKRDWQAAQADAPTDTDTSPATGIDSPTDDPTTETGTPSDALTDASPETDPPNEPDTTDPAPDPLIETDSPTETDATPNAPTDSPDAPHREAP